MASASALASEDARAAAAAGDAAAWADLPGWAALLQRHAHLFEPWIDGGAVGLVARAAADAGRGRMLVWTRVQGAMQVMEKLPDAVTIFILAPSREVLEQRLRKRSEDSEETIQRRLREASEEVRFAERYSYALINDDVAESVQNLVSIVRAERVKRVRLRARLDPILATYLNRAKS